MPTSARVCCWRDRQSEDASSTPARMPSGWNTGAAMQVNPP
jgi:hypothetical protein